MTHLDDELFAALLEAPQAYPQLREHLRGRCSVCEAFLATTHHPLLDAATDDALSALTPKQPHEEAREAAVYEKVERALSPNPARRLPYLAALAGLTTLTVWLFA